MGAFSVNTVDGLKRLNPERVGSAVDTERCGLSSLRMGASRAIGDLERAGHVCKPESHCDTVPPSIRRFRTFSLISRAGVAVDRFRMVPSSSLA